MPKSKWTATGRNRAEAERSACIALGMRPPETNHQETETMKGAKVGDKVTCNGYPGTITRVCEWSNSMVEVQLKSGLVCVDESELIPRED